MSGRIGWMVRIWPCRVTAPDRLPVGAGDLTVTQPCDAPRAGAIAARLVRVMRECCQGSARHTAPGPKSDRPADLAPQGGDGVTRPGQTREDREGRIARTQ